MQPCVLLCVKELQLLFLSKYDYDDEDIKAINFSMPQMNNATICQSTRCNIPEDFNLLSTSVDNQECDVNSSR
jgi:hypothetical protein